MKTKDAVTEFLEAKSDYSPRTLEQYRNSLQHLQEQCPEFPQLPKEIRQALNKLSTPWVRHAAWRIWKSFFHWCQVEYEIPDPMVKVDPPKLPVIDMRALEPLDLANVMAAAGSLPDKAVLALALDSGVRASEFGNLKVSDVGSSTIWIWGKGRKRVQVPVSPETLQLLDILTGKKKPDALLFTGPDGQPMSRFTVYRIVRRCMDKAGVSGPKRGPHCLRHSLGTNYIASGGDAFSLQKIMRHSNINTTRKYVHLAMNTVVEHHRQYSPLGAALRGARSVIVEREVEEILVSKGERWK